ncbi:MAG: rhomboid family intramembrane serine protease [Planctomycetota bacterium]|nr:rhomboid family intramembrane serine protease [Planctomycetota bacterium]
MIPLYDDLGRRGFTPIVFGLAAFWLAVLAAVHLLPSPIWGDVADLLTVGGPAFRTGSDALLDGHGDGAAKALFAVVAPGLFHGLCVGGLVPTLCGCAAAIAFGGRIESELGSGRFALLLFAASIAASIGSSLGDDSGLAGPGPMLVGLATAFLVAHPRARIVVLVPVVVVPVRATLPANFLAVVLLALQFGPVARFLQPFAVAIPGPRAFLAAGLVGVLAGLRMRWRSAEGRR